MRFHGPNNRLAMRAAEAMRQWKRERHDKRHPKAAEKAARAPAAPVRKLPRPAPTFSVVVTTAGTYDVTDAAGQVVAADKSHTEAWRLADRLDVVAGRDEDRRLRIATAFAERR